MSAIETARSRLTPKARLFVLFVLATVFLLGVLVGANILTIRDAVATGVSAILPALHTYMVGGRA